MNRHCIIMLLLVFSLLSIGCTGLDQERMTLSPPSRLEMDYGTSFNLMKFNQIANPEAEKNLEPVTGFDGQAAKVTLDKYRKDFEKPPEAPRYMLGFGTETQN